MPPPTRFTFPPLSALAAVSLLALSMPATVYSAPAASTAVADKALWWSYMAQWDTIPGKTELDLNLIEKAPIADYPYVVIAGTMYKGDPVEAKPAEADLPRLKALQDKTLALIGSRTPYIHAGTYTYDSYQKYYVYVKDKTGLDKQLRALYLRECKGCKMDVSVREDRSWGVYKQFLFPNAATRDHYRKELQKIGFLPK